MGRHIYIYIAVDGIYIAVDDMNISDDGMDILLVH